MRDKREELLYKNLRNSGVELSEHGHPIIETLDEHGVTVRMELVELIEHEGKQYVLANDMDDDEASYILYMRMLNDGNVELNSLDDEDEFNRITELLDN